MDSPPLPQKNSGGAHHFRFRFFDLCIRFGKMISKLPLLDMFRTLNWHSIAQELQFSGTIECLMLRI